MTLAAATPTDRERLAVLVADVLRVDRARVGDDVPFALLGLDSLTAAEITTLIEDAWDITLAPTTLFDHPTLGSLLAFVSTVREGGAPGACPGDRLAAMRDDARLPADVIPRGESRVTNTVLLTGATGFVGARLALELSRSTRVVCLVRAPDDRAGLERVFGAMRRFGPLDASSRDRVTAVAGDLTQPGLGLSPARHAALVDEIDTVYHAAADVDWVQPYDALRVTNVLGTVALLRLAATASPKRFVFLSSLASCYSTAGSRDVDESCDTMTTIEGLHLGYAQTKCVAEALVTEARRRGLDTTIVRPALVSGDSHTGVSNADDLVSRMLRGCIALGAAPDLDWAMDSVPVDHVARAIVAVRAPVLHLRSATARHWREAVLWMRLRGYAMQLVSYDDWAALVRERTVDRNHPLHGLRGFFLRRVEAEGGVPLPRLYEESRRRRARADVTDRLLAARGIGCPPADARLLQRYFDDYARTGALAAPPRVTRRAPLENRDGLARRIGSIVGDANARVTPLGGDASIVAELTSWRGGTSAGLYRAQGADVDAVVKIKALDRDVIEVGAHVARLCGPALGAAYERWQTLIGFTRGHERELAIAERREPAFVDHMPRLIATDRDSDRGEWTLAVEHVNDAVVIDADDRTWSDDEIETALQGLGRLHATWLDRTDTLRTARWLPPLRTATEVESMTPLWTALADHAAPAFAAWAGDAVACTHRRLASSVAEWRPVLDAVPQTLIHNDFNPRNVMIRGHGPRRRLCAYDWELTTLGAPQRDVMEFLCFVLDPATAASTGTRWIDRAREWLEDAAGRTIDAHEWRAGARAAHNELLIDRLAMYAMVHRFRAQRFLPRVVRTWSALSGV